MHEIQRIQQRRQAGGVGVEGAGGKGDLERRVEIEHVARKGGGKVARHQQMAFADGFDLSLERSLRFPDVERQHRDRGDQGQGDEQQMLQADAIDEARPEAGARLGEGGATQGRSRGSRVSDGGCLGHHTGRGDCVGDVSSSRKKRRGCPTNACLTVAASLGCAPGTRVLMDHIVINATTKLPLQLYRFEHGLAQPPNQPVTRNHIDIT